MTLEKATLEDYQNSIELDGSLTDHVQRVAAEMFDVPYGSVRARHKLEAARQSWTSFQRTLLEQEKFHSQGAPRKKRRSKK